jgi:hypothetical protein
VEIANKERLMEFDNREPSLMEEKRGDDGDGETT